MKNSILRRFTSSLFTTDRHPGDTTKSEATPSSSGPQIDSLEPRMLFSAAPVESPPPPAEADGSEEPQAVEESTAAETSTQQGQVTDSTGSGQNEAAPAASGETEVAAEQGVNLVSLDSASSELNQETLEAIAEAAAERWRATGLTAEQSAALDNLVYEIGDLDSLAIGKVNGNTVTIDRDAGGGNTWFIDATPFQDDEFSASGSAISGLGATGSYDLLSTLLHEQGHAIGLDDLPVRDSGVMSRFIEHSLRRLPTDGLAVGAEAGSIEGDHFMGALSPGDILIVDYTLDAVVKINPSTGARTIISSSSVGTGGDFGAPQDITVEDDGNLIVSDRTFNPGTGGIDHVVRVDPTTGNRTILSGPTTGGGPTLIQLTGQARAADGTIYVGDTATGSDAVFAIDPNTGNRSVFSGGSDAPGGPVGTGGNFETPTSIAVASNGDLYVIDRDFNGTGDHVVHIAKATGNRTVISGATKGTGTALNLPAGIEIGSDGMIYVGDQLADVIFKIDPVSGNRTIFSGPGVGSGGAFGAIRDLNFDSAGNLLVADYNFDPGTGQDRYVVKIAANGNRTIVSGGTTGSGTAFGQLNGMTVVPAAAPSNTAPTENANTGLTVNEGSSSNTIGQSALEFTDAEEGAGDVTFTIDILPANGTLHVGGGAAIALGATFTQAQINSNALTYNHDGSETTSDSFRFDVSDGQGGATNNVTFNLTITPQNDSPAILTNSGLTVNEGGSGTIATANLNENDPDDSGAGLTYTVTALPGNGSVKKNGTALVLNGTFTQADIDANNVTYEHDGSETTSDSFNFSLADGGENGASAATGTFNLTINPQNDSPAIGTNAGLTVAQGASGTIGNALIDENDPDDSGAGLTYTVTTLPVNGSVKKNGTALLLNETFTQADVDANNVTYEHNGSATTSDSFNFSLADGGENGASVATGTFNITVTPTAPAGDNTATLSGTDLTINAGGSGDTVTITSDGTTLKIHTPGDTIDGGAGTSEDTFGDVLVPVVGLTSITLNTGDDDDTININSLTGFTGSLDIMGGDGQDKVTFKADVELDDDNDANISAEEIDFVGASIETKGTGSIDIDGTGGGTGAFQGINLNGTDLTASGTGSVSLTGQGGDTGSSSQGIQFNNSSTVSTTDGDIILVGTGAGTGASGNGVSVLYGSSIDAGGGGNLMITGSASGNGTSSNDGVYFASGSSASVFDGTMTIIGTGDGTMISSRGVNLNGTLEGTGTGDIFITGTSEGTGSNNYGILSSGSIIRTTAGSGSISLTGTGSSNGLSTNVGVHITKGISGSIATGGNGGITINGQGGGTTTGTNNRGVGIEGGIVVTAAGDGAIIIDGSAGSGSIFNDGVRIISASQVTSVNGAITIRGTGGGTLLQNRGINLAGTVKSTGSGNVTLEGTGSQSSSSTLNQGVYVSGGTVSASTGDLTITGVGGTGSSSNAGVSILNSTVDGGGGSLITGTGGGTTTGNYGVYMQGISTTTLSAANAMGTKSGTTADDLFGNFF